MSRFAQLPLLFLLLAAATRGTVCARYDIAAAVVVDSSHRKPKTRKQVVVCKLMQLVALGNTKYYQVLRCDQLARPVHRGVGGRLKRHSMQQSSKSEFCERGRT